jgi:hypothetical protein
MDDSEAALADALPAAFPFADWGDERVRRDAASSLADELTDRGWALARRDPRQPRTCPRCGQWCVHDGWDHVHGNGIGIGSCKERS